MGTDEPIDEANRGPGTDWPVYAAFATLLLALSATMLGLTGGTGAVVDATPTEATIGAITTYGGLTAGGWAGTQAVRLRNRLRRGRPAA